MNLLLRPLEDINDPVWSVIISIIILLIGVSWVIRYILLVDTREAQEHGSHYKKERVRVAGVDTPEKRTRDLEEKELGIDATNWLKEKLDGAIAGDDDLVIRTELVGGMGKYGRLLGWLYIGDAQVSLNELMIEEGYAWAYDGGTKQKNFEELREIRRTHGTLV
jgi:micrococcal nuclease